MKFVYEMIICLIIYMYYVFIYNLISIDLVLLNYSIYRRIYYIDSQPFINKFLNILPF